MSRFAFLFLVATVSCLSFTPGAGAAEPPNIVFIFSDDQCFDTVAAFGHPEVETPNLDRIAKRATTVTHA